MNETAHERQIISRYRLRMTGALLAYACLLVATLLVLDDHPDAWWRFGAALLPVLPFLYGAFVVLQYVRSEDELQKQIITETLAMAFGGTAIASFAIGFLQIAGAPQINWTFVWPLMGVCWIGAGFIARRRYR
jgi:hypothetical protein